jgi:hypothetical protein
MRSLTCAAALFLFATNLLLAQSPTSKKNTAVDQATQHPSFRKSQAPAVTCVINEAVGEITTNPPFRPQGDYITFVYDAATGNTYWHDTTGLKSLPALPSVLAGGSPDVRLFSISRTATFAPVVFTRQKANMLFCNMHFGDSYAVQTVTNNVVEATADIRNGSATPASTIAPSPTLDSTTSAGASNSAAVAPGIQGTPSVISLAGLPIFNALKGDGSTYEQHTLVASSTQVAQSIDAYLRGTRAIKHQIDMFTEVRDIATSVTAIDTEIRTIYQPGAEYHFYSNQPLFVEESVKVQHVISQLNTLSTDLTSASFLPRAITLASNYATIQTIATSISDRIAYDLLCPAPAATTKPDIFKDIDHCAPHEAAELSRFLADVDTELAYFRAGGATATSQLIADKPALLAKKISDLQGSLESLHSSTETLFTEMNDWYSKSSVQDVKALPSLQSNATIQLSLSVKRNFTPFQFGTPLALSAGATPVSSPFQPIVNSLLLEVHRKVYFNVIGGILAFHIPSNTYAFQHCKDSTGAAGYCPYLSSSSKFQVQGVVGVVWYPWGRDYFPFGTSQSVGVSGWQRLKPGFVMGTSITSLGNAFGGVNIEPTNGVDFYFGGANGTSTSLAPGTTTSSFFADDKYLPTQTTQHVGFAFGVGLDYTVFCSIFKKGCGS